MPAGANRPCHSGRLAWQNGLFCEAGRAMRHNDSACLAGPDFGGFAWRFGRVVALRCRVVATIQPGCAANGLCVSVLGVAGREWLIYARGRPHGRTGRSRDACCKIKSFARQWPRHRRRRWSGHAPWGKSVDWQPTSFAVSTIFINFAETEQIKTHDTITEALSLHFASCPRAGMPECPRQRTR